MNDLTINQNPFAAPAEAGPSTLAVVTEGEVERERALVETQATLAHANPRVPAQCWEEIKDECSRVGLAADAVYEFPMGGSLVSGASIRLTEALARRWRHMYLQIRILASHNGMTKGRSLAWDLQNNIRHELDFEVLHSRDKRDREGNVKPVPVTSAREIDMMVLNAASRRMRNCILRLIPGEVVDRAIAECDKTLAKLGPPEDMLQDALTRLAAFSVEQKHIEERIGHALTRSGNLVINVREIVRLQRIAKAIEDGFGQPSGYFPSWQPKPAKPTGTQRTMKTAAFKSEVWPKKQMMDDGSIRWLGRGDEVFVPGRHQAYEDGRPVVNEDGTLIGIPGQGVGRSRTETGAEQYSMSPKHADPEAIIGEIEESRDMRRIEEVRIKVRAFPLRHPDFERVVKAFDDKLIGITRRVAEGWPQPLTLADGRLVQIDCEGTIWDEAKHAKGPGGQPSMRQDHTFRKRKETRPKTTAEQVAENQSAQSEGKKKLAPGHEMTMEQRELAQATPGATPANAMPPGAMHSPPGEAGEIWKAIDDADLDDKEVWTEIAKRIDELPATDPDKLRVLRYFEANQPI